MLSPKNFLVEVKDVLWKRHSDQLRLRSIPNENYKNFKAQQTVYPTAIETHDGIVRHENSVNSPLFGKDSSEMTNMQPEMENDSMNDLNLSRESPVEPERIEGAGEAFIVENDIPTSQRQSNRIRKPTKRYINEA